MLVLWLGFSIGNHFGGQYADRSINRTLIVLFIVLIVSMLSFPYLAQSPLGAAIALIIWGAAAFGLVPPVQMRVMSIAHKASGLASSINIGAFNLEMRSEPQWVARY